MDYFTEVVAGLSLIISVCATGVAYKSKRESIKNRIRANAIYKAEKRTEHLVEMERKNAAQGKLLYILSKRLLLYREYPRLENYAPGDVSRLSNNIELVSEQLSYSRGMRIIAEKAMKGDCFDSHEKALADIKRLTLTAEKESIVEEDAYKECLRKIELYDLEYSGEEG